MEASLKIHGLGCKARFDGNEAHLLGSFVSIVWGED